MTANWDDSFAVKFELIERRLDDIEAVLANKPEKICATDDDIKAIKGVGALESFLKRIIERGEA